VTFVGNWSYLEQRVVVHLADCRYLERARGVGTPFVAGSMRDAVAYAKADCRRRGLDDSVRACGVCARRSYD